MEASLCPQDGAKKQKEKTSSRLSVRTNFSKDEPPNFSNEKRNPPCSETDGMDANYEQGRTSPSLKHNNSLERGVTFKSTPSTPGPHGVQQVESELKLPPEIKDWTKEHVKHWLIVELRVPQKIANSLFEQELSGACLVSFEKNDLIELGVPPAPAIQIIRQVEKFSRDSETSEPHGRMPKRHYELSKGELHKTAEMDAVTRNENETEETETVSSDSGFQSQSSTAQILQRARDRIRSVIDQNTINDTQIENETTENVSFLHLKKSICQLRPFDKSNCNIFYLENDILPPIAGPSNLLDPIHEYQLLLSADEASEREILYEFTKEVFTFAASCMNSRTNGTIHFGVQHQSDQGHGEVIGHHITSFSKYNEAFESCLSEYFEEKHVNAARMCIRPPKFIQVNLLDGRTSNKWVIEVDVVPTYSETQQNIFYTLLSVASAGKKQQCKTECIFVRDGLRSINILADTNPRVCQEKMKHLADRVQCLASARKAAEEQEETKPFQGHQGQRLKQLITCGRDSFETTLQFIVVTDKCHSSQLEHLEFLKELKLFAVLDFDPESDKNGTCNFYRRDHVANLHYPSMYTTQDSVTAAIGKLNLFKQTSWIFCNGRVNETSETDRPLTDGEWLKKRSGEVNNTVSFLCNPDLLSKDTRVMFILHSAVTDISSPILETFCAMYRTLEGADNMLCICKNTDVFKHWQQLIEIRCKEDITSKCIYELSLNEISCTILKLREPQTQSSRRFLPSTGSSSVLLAKKDEELMSVLDILCENECQDTEIETKASFDEFKNKTEEDFYRGGQVSWWNFYLSEMKGSLPFIKRDKFNELYDLITPVEGYTIPFVMINLFHHPGCGGTTLAMHVLWNLKHKFRCAVVKNNIATNNEVAAQVMTLLTYGREDQSGCTPVLLLVDNRDDVEDLKQSIISMIRKRINSIMVIILNCERTQFPRESATNSRISNVFITNKLSSKEQSLFSEKLQQVKENHNNPETFYAFMIMTNNFSETYITNVVSNIVKDLDPNNLQGRLFSFLALLNTYINGSYMSLSLCESLLGLRSALRKQETLDDMMNPYSTLMITFTAEDHGTYKAVRFLHQMIANKCLEILTKEYKLSLAEITTDVLHCDRIYRSCMGKDFLVQNIQSMLITRHRKEQGDDKDTLFSPLIEQMHEEEGHEITKQVLEKATETFDRSATVPQALARYLCLKVKDFESALKWALDAQRKNPNSYIADTVGQVYKSRLKNEIESCENLTPETLDKCLTLGFKAIKAFQDSQELAKKDEQVDPFDLVTKRKSKSYNTSGYIGETEVTMLLLSIIKDLPLFAVGDKHKRDQMLHFLRDQHPVSSLHDHSKKAFGQFFTVLAEHERSLMSLKPRLKEIFTFFEHYFLYLKPRSMERETADERHKRKVSEYFKKYIELFNLSEEEKASETASKPKLSLSQAIVDQRCYLEIKRADSFAGLLQCLNEKNPKEMERILEKWQFILDNSPRKSVADTANYILANIVLYNFKPSSKLLRKFDDLVDLLNTELQKEGINSRVTELYYLSMLLMWPSHQQRLEQTATNKDISMYIASARKSFQKRFSYMFPARSTIAHFFLGKSSGLGRIVSKVKLDHILITVSKKEDSQCGLSSQSRHRHNLWQTGAAWKEPEVQKKLLRVKGKSENGEIYVIYGGNLKMMVRPVYLGDIRSGYSREDVSFYLGFTMEGPVAYDIKYENDP
ncbi:sterile alpha motif domain-containing protein 9-like [Echeneis naucrates]|uniref:Sterile alpha motif domain-containing protein 9-like n=1 Tax=Echeneis naucrates TaxID=173247 RepID=A0A665V908_ECHNA|nr:sterile alpha motif domain-containing protein 9-like [Echeneis naucrates]XP_029384071.1 sterile alpha motif domain-containing protein 9-like [Echeneis naucrates]XP_029384072.1 sterile alpha motif domain-containing protein 9-like [Echeneis naucrates]